VASKINDLTTSVNAGGGSGPVAPVREVAPGTHVVPQAGSGEVHITDTATRLAAVEQTLRDSPAVDSARVALLRSAIEQGNYTVRPEHAATQLMQMEHALAGLTEK
jgi:negative regulator of flagellin synthesis FlgM